MKIVIIFFAAAAFLLGIGGATLLRANEVSSFSEGLETLNATESQCLSSSEKNTGKCSKKVDGSGDACVESHWYEHNDCFAQR